MTLYAGSGFVHISTYFMESYLPTHLDAEQAHPRHVAVWFAHSASC
jgi:hypothetical protein